MNHPDNFLIAGKMKSTLLLLVPFRNRVTIKQNQQQQQQQSHSGKQEAPDKTQETEENTRRFHQTKD